MMDGKRMKIKCDTGEGGGLASGALSKRRQKSHGTVWMESDWSFASLLSRDENKRDAAGFPEASLEPWSTALNRLFFYDTKHTG